MILADLCSGYGGASLALEPLGFTTAFFAETDKHASKVLAHHWPGVPNVGDIETADWRPWAGRIDAVSAGFPCQDLSSAGRGEGLMPGNRSGLWFSVARAIAALMPALVFVENSPMLRTRKGSRGGTDAPVRDLGWEGLDDGESKALGIVLGDLASLGYDSEWGILPASAVGACHERKRLAIFAWHPSADPCGTARRQVARGAHGDEAADGAQVPDIAGGGGEAGAVRLPTPTAGDSRSGRNSTATRHREPPTGVHGGNTLTDVLVPAMLPTPRTSDGNGTGEHGTGGPDLRTVVGRAAAARSIWGRSEPLRRRHALILGRDHPDPLVGKVLNPAFVEWMQMLPEGHVTGLGLSTTAQLRILGNGWVIPWARMAFGLLAERSLQVPESEVPAILAEWSRLPMPEELKQ